MKRLILLFLACRAFAATNNVTAGAVWEVWSTGSANNGGCFDTSNKGATGVDYSAGTGAQFTMSGTLSTSGAGSTTLTATGSPWDNTILGNCVRITAGTGFTAGYYVVTGYTDANNVGLNVSPSPGGAGSGGTGYVGGATISLAQAETGVVAGNFVWVKATGTYNVTANTTFATAGTTGNPIIWIGYTSTHGDGGQPTIQDGATSTLDIFSVSGTLQRFNNFLIDCNSKTTTQGVNAGANQLQFSNFKITNCTKTGFTTGNSNVELRNSWISGLTSAGTAGINVTSTGNLFLNNRVTGGAKTGISDSGSAVTTVNIYIGNILDNNTGAATDGFTKGGTGGMIFIGNDVYANGRDGLHVNPAAGFDWVSIRNNIIYGNVSIGIESSNTNYTSAYGIDINYNGVGGNGTDRSNVPAGANDVTLTVDPFVAGSSNNFALNSTSGGGAALKAAGFPGVPQSGGTGYLDIGSLQSQASGGAAQTSSTRAQ